MFGISIVLLVADTTGSYAIAGGVSAVGLVGVAVSAPLVGRLVDRHGQAKIAVPATLISVTACTGTALCAEFGAPRWTLYITYLASAGVPFVGTMVRARWVAIYEGDEQRLHTANAFERIVDESVFISGPAIAAALCGTLGASAGLIAANVLLLVGTLLFAMQRSTEPAPHPAGPDDVRPRLVDHRISSAIALFLILGLVSGAMEVVTVAYVATIGSKSAAGLFLGLAGLGSCLSGVVYGTYRPEGDVRRRTLLFAAILSCCLLPFPVLVQGNLWVLGLWAFLVGTASAPILITSMSLLQQLTPKERMNEGMAMADAGIVVGMAVGALAGGWIVTRYGNVSGFWTLTFAGVLVLLMAVGGTLRWNTNPAGANTEEVGTP
ncbi:MFS transporter [Kitasatospora sp. NPDC057015]|uniref:MFS transporter n=1 Tax=Kitasatospora sp. NPDC057015 TaxID=3346001 RepID=UPI00364076C7